MLDEPGQTTPTRDPVEDGPAAGYARAAVVAPTPDAAAASLTGSHFQHVTVLGADARHWLDLPEVPFDLAVVLGVAASPSSLASLLAAMDGHLTPEATLALSVSPGDTVDTDVAAWAPTLDGWTFVAVGRVGDESCVLLRSRPADEPGEPAEVRAGLVVGALAGLAARRMTPTPGEVELAALRREAETRQPGGPDRRPTGGGSSRRTARRAPAGPVRRLLRSRRNRRLLLAAGAGVVAILLVVGIVTEASWWASLVVAALVAAVALRQEMWNRRLSRRLGRLARISAANKTVLQRLVTSSRANAGATRALSARLTTGTAKALDAAASGSSLRDALLPGGVLDLRLRREFEQVQATVNLFSRVQVERKVPPMRGWAASPDVLNVLLDEFVSTRPSIVVECGSGVSTLWLALAARQNGIDCRIVSLDHDAEFMEHTRRTLAQHGVADRVELRHAPLTTSPVEGHNTFWYDTSALADLVDVGLVFVDGPPELTGAMARYPALPVLAPHLSRHGTLILDDASRADEKAAVERWLVLHPDFTAISAPAEKGAVILRRNADDASGA